MAKIIQFQSSAPPKFGFKKAKYKKGKKKINLEDFGQLNIFDQVNEAKVVSLKPDVSHFESALYLDEQGRIDSAEKEYLSAIDSNENTADAYCNLGIIYSTQRKNTEAINAFTQCLKADPRHFEAHFNLANLFSEIGNIPLAKVHYEMSVTINPEFSNGYFNLGLLLATNQEYESAIDAFLKYKETAPPSEKENALELIKNINNSIAT